MTTFTEEELKLIGRVFRREKDTGWTKYGATDWRLVSRICRKTTTEETPRLLREDRWRG